ncbi:type II toxin-antitoxin system VapC family toxin [Sphingomonas sp. LB-2]|uniref:type II toxin-antitoxin system VapC family toxin n=1 Tax=Sphingomonas caeni TaxID=2984949 RepID=UPI002231CA9E|nr:type II toxin-antitoxin system VapC family toxin [Sphingomonas caeni]MCW3847532.1 type II toxin-antitoxin system VapC family toxin [Sphingomonas caeni]
MIVDTSAIVAILLGEAEGSEFERKLENVSGSKRMSAGSRIELSAILFRTSGEVLEARGGQLLLDLGVMIEPVTLDQVQTARDAYRRFGRGSGKPGCLNFGDCFAYALAKARGEPLLFKGGDFAQTDIIAA